MKTYDPSQVVCIFGGIITGYAEGSFLEVGRAEEMWKLVVGANGETCRIRNPNISGMVTLTLMQSSISNDVLGGLATLDELTGAGVLPLLIKDLNGTAIVASPEAWIVKVADMGFGKDLTDRKWAICCAKMYLEGGLI